MLPLIVITRKLKGSCHSCQHGSHMLNLINLNQSEILVIQIMDYVLEQYPVVNIEKKNGKKRKKKSAISSLTVLKHITIHLQVKTNKLYTIHTESILTVFVDCADYIYCQAKTKRQ